MTIGIFGGSFNPIHKGHVAIAKGVLASGLVDEVWLMVSPRNPLKEESDLMPDQERLRLVRRALKGLKGIKASNFEFSLPKPSYTYVTMQRLEEAYPHHRFALIMGGDNWQRFHLWRNHEQLLADYPIIVYPRQGSSIDPTTLPPSVSYVDLPLYNISSTQVRQGLAKGEDVSHLLPDQPQ